MDFDDVYDSDIDCASPTGDSPSAASPSIASTSVASPNITSPRVASPTGDSSIASPTGDSSIASPSAASPSVASPSIASPCASPSIASPSKSNVASPSERNNNQVNNNVAVSSVIKILGLHLDQVEIQLGGMLNNLAQHGPYKLATRPQPNRSPYSWLFHREQRDTADGAQVCYACKQPHMDRVSSFRIKVHARDGNVFYQCTKTERAVQIGTIAGAQRPAGNNNKKKRKQGTWKHDNNRDWLDQPVAPRIIAIDNMAQSRERAYHDERDEIIEAIRRIISSDAVLVPVVQCIQREDDDDNSNVAASDNNGEEGQQHAVVDRDIVQFRLSANSETIYNAHIDRRTGIVTVEHDNDNSVVVHALYDEFFALDDARPIERIDTESDERFSAAACRAAFHVERFTLNCALRAQRRGVEYLNRFVAAFHATKDTFVIKSFDVSTVPSGVRVLGRDRKCSLRQVSLATLREEFGTPIYATDPKCLAALVSRDGLLTNAAPLVDVATALHVRPAISVWLESVSLRRAYTNYQFQPLPPRGLCRLHAYLEPRFDAAMAARGGAVLSENEMPFYNSNRRDYEDVACLGGYRVVALAHMFHNFCVLVGGNVEIWAEWVGFFAHVLQAPFEKCCQMMVLICTRGAGKSECATWLKSVVAPAHINMTATASTCLQHFNEPLRDRTFVFLDEFNARGLSNECLQKLNALVTAKQMSIEAKGVDPVQCVNLLHFLVASDNADALKGGRHDGGGGGETTNTNGAGQRLRRPIVCDSDATPLNWDGIPNGLARSEAYFGTLYERFGLVHDALGHSATANFFYAVDMSLLAFNPSANAKPTEARRKQMVLALGGVAKFVLQILDGSIAQTRSYIAAPFWIEDDDGSGNKTWNGPIALSVLFETYKHKMLAGGTTSLTEDQFAEQMAEYTPPRLDLTRAVATGKRGAKRGGAATSSAANSVVVTRASRHQDDQQEQQHTQERQLVYQWPKWSVCRNAFVSKTGISIDEWRAMSDDDNQADADRVDEDRQDDDDAVPQYANECEKFCDNVLPLAKPMRADATLFEPDALCQQLCTYFDMRSVGGWRRSVDNALDDALAVAASKSRQDAQLDGSDDIIDGSLLPLLVDYAPEQSFAQSSVAPLDRVPESLRRRVREFANQHSVDVALLLLPDGVWAAVESATVSENRRANTTALTETVVCAAPAAPCLSRMISTAAKRSCFGIAAASSASASSAASSASSSSSSSSSSAAAAAPVLLARIEERMQPIWRVAESMLRPLDIVRRDRRNNDVPLVCIALWGRHSADQGDEERELFAKPLARR